MHCGGGGGGGNAVILGSKSTGTRISEATPALSMYRHVYIRYVCIDILTYSMQVCRQPLIKSRMIPPGITYRPMSDLQSSLVDLRYIKARRL